MKDMILLELEVARTRNELTSRNLMPVGALHRTAYSWMRPKVFEQEPVPPEHVKVFGKIRPGICVYNGLFKLVDARQETSNKRSLSWKCGGVTKDVAFNAVVKKTFTSIT
jgi:hypothetical protein